MTIKVHSGRRRKLFSLVFSTRRDVSMKGGAPLSSFCCSSLVERVKFVLVFCPLFRSHITSHTFVLLHNNTSLVWKNLAIWWPSRIAALFPHPSHFPSFRLALPPPSPLPLLWLPVMVWLSPQGSPKEGRAGAVGNKCLIIGLIIIPGGIHEQDDTLSRRRIRIRVRAFAQTHVQTNKHDAAQTPAVWQYGKSWCVNYCYIAFSQQAAHCDLTLWCAPSVIDFFHHFHFREISEGSAVCWKS